MLLHVRTRKGRGYRPAEADKVCFHGAALPPDDGGRQRATAASPSDGDATPSDAQRAAAARKPPNYTAVHRRGAAAHRSRR